MKGQSGVIYPLVITICFLVLAFFGYLTEKVYSERQFIYRQEEQMREVRLVQQAMEKTSKLLAGEYSSYPKEYYFTWKEGNVKVTVKKQSDDEMLLIDIKAITKQQHTKNIQVYYNVSQNSVTKWVEG